MEGVRERERERGSGSGKGTLHGCALNCIKASLGVDVQVLWLTGRLQDVGGGKPRGLIGMKSRHKKGCVFIETIVRIKD
ncbi:hypothetical protein E2C01_092532 [Portunus trituberculatus]|uniref:Uncharacterized protein n=1 Tax=Portunus trituberculatus TaxID=210409 RepID=A0A5B7JW19_PORTR|nr:hypothetical protein [Portunus trituberculatus]